MILRELTTDEEDELRELQREFDEAIDLETKDSAARRMSKLLRRAERRAAARRLRPTHIQRGCARVPLQNIEHQEVQ